VGLSDRTMTTIIIGAVVGWRWCYSRENPRFGSPGSDDADARRRSTPVRHCFWRNHWLAVVLRWSGVSPPASTMVGLSSMVLLKLDGGCVLCYVRREVESSDVVVVSMSSLVRGVTLV
jgi:hypothetical protein